MSSSPVTPVSARVSAGVMELDGRNDAAGRAIDAECARHDQLHSAIVNRSDPTSGKVGVPQPSRRRSVRALCDLSRSADVHEVWFRPMGPAKILERAGPSRSSMTITTTEIRSEPHHEIGSIISRDADRLVDRWCTRALAEQPTASRVYLDVLQNELRRFLQAVGRGLLQDGEPRQHRDQAKGHGEQRWDNGWSLTELVHDYQILQLVVLEHLESELDRPLGYRE